MELSLRKISIPRKRPLTISRGTSGVSENLFVTVTHEGIQGLGEAASVGYGREQNAETAVAELSSLEVSHLRPSQVVEIERAAVHIGSAARSALVNACFDWLGKRAGMSTTQLLGLSPASAKTSITVGINTPEAIRELAPALLAETGTNLLKLKLGGSDGIGADKERFLAAKQSSPAGTQVRVDANGGWSVSDALEMIKWLAKEGCDYVEQPLGFEDSDGLAEIMKTRTIPVYVDEFVSTSKDVVAFVDKCDGINVKLMKSGGIAEAMRVAHTARAHGLGLMIGCFGESSIGIAAAVAIGSLFDHIDLDSHLNMEPDPASGLAIDGGVVSTSASSGLGVSLS